MKRSGIRIKRWLTHIFALRTADLRHGYLGAMIMILCASFIRLLSGSPYRSYLLLQSTCLMPPLSLLSLINLFFTAAMGFACGLVLSCHRRSARELKYQGGMLFILLAVFWFGIYPLIFRGGMLFTAFLLLIAAWILTLGCVLIFSHIQILAGGICATFLCWLTYLAISLLGCILRL